jgi:hypothetical protein
MSIEASTFGRSHAVNLVGRRRSSALVDQNVYTTTALLRSLFTKFKLCCRTKISKRWLFYRKSFSALSWGSLPVTGRQSTLNLTACKFLVFEAHTAVDHSKISKLCISCRHLVTQDSSATGTEYHAGGEPPSLPVPVPVVAAATSR